MLHGLTVQLSPLLRFSASFTVVRDATFSNGSLRQVYVNLSLETASVKTKNTSRRLLLAYFSMLRRAIGSPITIMVAAAMMAIVLATLSTRSAADPDAILVMPCGFDLERAAREMYWLTGRAGWSGLQAVRNGQVWVADGNQYFNRPGPRLVESLQILAEILHPEAFEPTLEGSAWRSQARAVAAH